VHHGSGLEQLGDFLHVRNGTLFLAFFGSVEVEREAVDFCVFAFGVHTSIEDLVPHVSHCQHAISQEIITETIHLIILQERKV
jgi:hypothetical protein